MNLSKMILVGVFTCLAAQPAPAASWWKAITKRSDVPQQLSSMLSDCSVTSEKSSDWLDGDNLARIDLGNGKTMWLSSCELSASQKFSAIVIETPNGFQRIIFEQFVDGELIKLRQEMPGVIWKQKSKILIARSSGGCAGYSGARMTYKWTGKIFRLIEQAESSECINPKNWPVVYRAK